MAKILYLKFFNDLLSDIVQHIIDPIPLCTYRLIVIAHSGLVIALFTSDNMCNVDQEEGS